MVALIADFNARQIMFEDRVSHTVGKNVIRKLLDCHLQVHAPQSSTRYTVNTLGSIDDIVVEGDLPILQTHLDLPSDHLSVTNVFTTLV